MLADSLNRQEHKAPDLQEKFITYHTTTTYNPTIFLIYFLKHFLVIICIYLRNYLPNIMGNDYE